MENSGVHHTQDCIYEDMTSTSPLTDEGYITSSGSSSSRFRFSSASRDQAVSRDQPGRSGVRPPPLSVYMNMDGKSRDQEATLVPDVSRGLLSREVSRDGDATLRANCYEYIDIEFPPRDQPSPAVAPPCLPSRNKKPSRHDIFQISPQESARNSAGQARDKLSEGLKSYQEQSRLQKEMMLDFSSSLLESNSRNGVSNCQNRAFMNSAVWLRVTSSRLSCTLFYIVNCSIEILFVLNREFRHPFEADCRIQIQESRWIFWCVKKIRLSYSWIAVKW